MHRRKKVTLYKIPLESLVLLGLPSRMLEDRRRTSMAQVGKAIVMFEGESEGIEIILETH